MFQLSCGNGEKKNDIIATVSEIVETYMETVICQSKKYERFIFYDAISKISIEVHNFT